MTSPRKTKGGGPAGEILGGTSAADDTRAEAADRAREKEKSEVSYLDGQMLIAMPVMNDERFERSVIYVCAHSPEGAMGIIVNRPAGSIDFPALLMQLKIIDKNDRIALPEDAEAMKAQVPDLLEEITFCIAGINERYEDYGEKPALKLVLK